MKFKTIFIPLPRVQKSPKIISSPAARHQAPPNRVSNNLIPCGRKTSHLAAPTSYKEHVCQCSTFFYRCILCTPLFDGNILCIAFYHFQVSFYRRDEENHQRSEAFIYIDIYFSLLNFRCRNLHFKMSCFIKARKVVTCPLTIPHSQCLVVTNLCKNWPIFLFGNEQMDNEHWRAQSCTGAKRGAPQETLSTLRTELLDTGSARIKDSWECHQYMFTVRNLCDWENEMNQ